MSVTSTAAGPDAGLGGVADDLARASLALARRFSAGGSMWCASRAWPFHAHHVAVEFVHPVIVGKRALAAVTVPPGADVVATLRASVRPGDMVVALARADDEPVADAMRRGQAWGVETLWMGFGPRPAPGAADHVVWLDTDDELEASERLVRLYHMLWELTHVCFEHPGLLKAELVKSAAECTDEVCITCSDEGRLAEVITLDGDEALVRTGEGVERIDTMLIDPPRPNDLLLVHAGSAISNVSETGGES
ncbi:MAG TPA: HypC/HybG/HupF family hydrogenase formation chaperone [Acidimicrobiales bacterium]|nr:HypC/HybG/HupF family hydrogenase formation chaperone [Acidimicrobiales bacterium]